MFYFTRNHGLIFCFPRGAQSKMYDFKFAAKTARFRFINSASWQWDCCRHTHTHTHRAREREREHCRLGDTGVDPDDLALEYLVEPSRRRARPSFVAIRPHVNVVSNVFQHAAEQALLPLSCDIMGTFAAIVECYATVSGGTVALLKQILQGAPKKSNPLGKILYLWNYRSFSPNLHRLQMRIQATYPANLLK